MQMVKYLPLYSTFILHQISEQMGRINGKCLKIRWDLKKFLMPKYVVFTYKTIDIKFCSQVYKISFSFVLYFHDFQGQYLTNFIVAESII